MAQPIVTNFAEILSAGQVQGKKKHDNSMLDDSFERARKAFFGTGFIAPESSTPADEIPKP